jgi:hypothetical protein
MMMADAERFQTIAPEQYGSRKYHAAIDQAVNKTLACDLIWQLRIPGAFVSSDLKSCYDRIVHSMASIAMQANGVPESCAICMFTTIQNLKHTVRTAFGDSDKTYGNKVWAVPLPDWDTIELERIPPHGIGQGNGAGPQIWAVVSTPVLATLRQRGFGTFFQAAITKHQINFVGFSFVDDTNLIQTARNMQETGIDVAMAAREAMQVWQHDIHLGGGEVVPAKSFWYLIDFVWKGGIWSYAPARQNPYDLVVESNQTETVLERLEVHEAKKSLGIMTAPDGNWKAQRNRMQEQARTWAEHIKAGYLRRVDAWTGMEKPNEFRGHHVESTPSIKCHSRTTGSGMDRICLWDALPKMGTSTSGISRICKPKMFRVPMGGLPYSENLGDRLAPMGTQEPYPARQRSIGST